MSDAPKDGWIRLYELPRGAVFETIDGTRAVKSEYGYDNGGCQCILLASGEYAHFGGTPRAHNAAAALQAGDWETFAEKDSAVDAMRGELHRMRREEQGK